MPDEVKETPTLKAKLEAETEKLKAEVMALDVVNDRFRAEAEAFEALAAFNNAQARRVEEEIREAHEDYRIKRATAETEEIDLERFREKRLAEMAADHRHHIYPFSSDVSSTSVKSCIDKLTEWMRTSPEGTEIEIVFNSPGGSVISGMALFDYIQTVRRAGFKVTTSTVGYAASMAGILLQAGDWRVMGRESWLMIHEASFGAGGKIGEVEDTVEWVKKVCERIANIFVKRCQGADPATATKPLTRGRFIAGWRRKDWWLCSEDALTFGLIDEIR